MSVMASPTSSGPAGHKTGGAQQFCEPALADRPAARPGRFRAKRAALTLAAAASLLTLGAPIAAQASTRPSAHITRPAAAVRAPAALAAAVVRPGGSYTGQGGPCTFTTIVAPYECEQYALAAPYSGCYVQVGDYYRTDRWAEGAAYVGCPTKHTYRSLLYLDVMYSSSNPDFTAEESVSGTPIYAGGENVTTGSYCGGPARNWETYVRISIDGSAYSGYFTSQYGNFPPGAC